MTKYPPKGVVVLSTAMFNGENYKQPKADADEKMAVYIPRAEVATLDVSVSYVQVVSFLDFEIKFLAESASEQGCNLGHETMDICSTITNHY